MTQLLSKETCTLLVAEYKLQVLFFMASDEETSACINLSSARVLDQFEREGVFRQEFYWGTISGVLSGYWGLQNGASYRSATNG